MSTELLQFKIDAQAESGINTTWRANAPTGEISCAIPPEFGGPGKAFSPEDLLGFAALQCFIGTFKVVAANSRLTYARIEGSCTLSLERAPGKSPSATKLELQVRLFECADPEKAVRIMRKVADTAIVICSIRLPKTFQFHVDQECFTHSN